MTVEPPSESVDREWLRRFATDCQEFHDPDRQGADAWPGRCAACSYTRHPCDVYELATAVLALLDEEPPSECEHGAPSLSCPCRGCDPGRFGPPSESPRCPHCDREMTPLAGGRLFACPEGRA